MDEQITKLLARDLTQDFVTAFQERLDSEYSATYEELSSVPGSILSSGVSEMDALNLTEARRARRANGLRALGNASKDLGVPFEVKRLACNGQQVVVSQLGQVLVISEPVDHLMAKPEHAQYKMDLAASHFAIRQLELDLGDGYRQRIDARNTVLAVIQHGMHAHTFSRRDTALSMLRVAVPDVSFNSWLWKANVLNDELAFMLDWKPEALESGPRTQEDRVTVKLKSAVQREE